ncbi:NAD-dependent succinate-semialdehyde dehydrogenase [Legionella sp. km772]|uniref:NAD-dependent succinate-semialdehyde dehydrogenase n=1 Tax=Legionella sp. km772 TaxID=2498111 RepID=UPI000F8E9BD7|nr:NAD-dependent succinate-semialdehyde dehydrogenase [Legionella sp. km772]RUR13197.1 NAD-dependent succinate-semialdehyde dehydrogenase [Legionella sp. km772]
MKIQTINPATEQILASYDCLSDKEIHHKIKAGQDAYLSWRTTDFATRKKKMRRMTRLLREQTNASAELMSLEMGKPITPGRAEIEKCARLCEHYIEHVEEYLAPRIINTEMRLAKVCHNPLGIVFAIMPWNFPFWQVFRFAVPTILAGNAALLRHAPISTGTGNKIQELFEQAGFPPSLFQHLIVDNNGASTIIEHPLIIAVTLTGSERAGRSVAEQAGKNLKKSVLELGGCDPYLVLEDADLELAAQNIVSSRLNNTGQVCIAAKRVIVIKTIEEQLLEKIQQHMSHFTTGDPLDPQTKLGPMARKDLRETLQIQVEKSLKQGAKLLGGGIIPDGRGFYYPPTLLTRVKPGMPAFDEELFGPVIAICSAENEEEAIRLANMGQYGLGAAVFTKDLKRGERIATEEIESGVCFVNALVASDPRLPFGGIKNSGYGRELSKEGILEFVNTKTIVVSD